MNGRVPTTVVIDIPVEPTVPSKIIEFVLGFNSPSASASFITSDRMSIVPKPAIKGILTLKSNAIFDTPPWIKKLLLTFENG